MPEVTDQDDQGAAERHFWLVENAAERFVQPVKRGWHYEGYLVDDEDGPKRNCSDSRPRRHSHRAEVLCGQSIQSG